jgi:hypothetical protein
MSISIEFMGIFFSMAACAAVAPWHHHPVCRHQCPRPLGDRATTCGVTGMDTTVITEALRRVADDVDAMDIAPPLDVVNFENVEMGNGEIQTPLNSAIRENCEGLTLHLKLSNDAMEAAQLICKV